MLRSAAGKVTWMARATTTVVGLAIMLALVLGVATSAMGADGQNFVLGKLNNAATKVTGLVGDVDGAAALRVTNPNAGTNDTALDLRVQAGEAPMRVNSGARVANLNAARAGQADTAASADTATAAQNAANAQNADALDGKSSEQFLSKTEKAADATHADQADSAINAQNADKLGGRVPGGFASASHDHDHRYSPRLFAAIRGQDAVAIRSSNLQATFKYLGMAGSYEIVFDRDVSSCVYSATLINETAGRGSEAPNGQIGVRPLYTSPQGVSVTTYDGLGARADRDFSIVVHC